MYESQDFYRVCDKCNADFLFMRAPAPGVTMRMGDRYRIFFDFSQINSSRFFRSVSCHEISHVGSGSLHQVDSPYESAERSEYRANRYTAEHFLTADDFRAAFASGCREIWELADYFDLDERIVKNALSYWTEHRGIDFNN